MITKNDLVLDAFEELIISGLTSKPKPSEKEARKRAIVMRGMKMDGKTYREIGEKHGVSGNRVMQIIKKLERRMSSETDYRKAKKASKKAALVVETVELPRVAIEDTFFHLDMDGEQVLVRDTHYDIDWPTERKLDCRLPISGDVCSCRYQVPHVDTAKKRLIDRYISENAIDKGSI